MREGSEQLKQLGLVLQVWTCRITKNLKRIPGNPGEIVLLLRPHPGRNP